MQRRSFLCAATAFGLTAPAWSQGPLPVVDAEVRQIDKATQTIALRHGDIKNVDMPAMTMVFRVKDAAMLDAVKVGDKIKFSADKVGGVITVVWLEAVKP
jgi:Cu/Ag efflux protein CusF